MKKVIAATGAALTVSVAMFALPASAHAGICGTPLRASASYDPSMAQLATDNNTTVSGEIAGNLRCMGGTFYRGMASVVNAGHWHARFPVGMRFWQ